MNTTLRALIAGRLNRALLAAASVVAVSGCSSILDVKNPNNIAESSLSNPVAADAETNGVQASLSRMLSGIAVPYAEATDELDWIGSRDSWGELDAGAISDYTNEFTDGAFPNVGEIRYLGDQTISRLEGFDKAGLLRNRTDLTRTYLYTAIAYASIADMFDDFAFSNKTVPAPAVGRANMSKLYDTAIDYLNKGLAVAQALGDKTNQYNILAYRARVRHAKGVWQKITPVGQVPAQPLVNDAGAVADAQAALALSAPDAKFTLFDNIEATAGINIWYEVNGRNESALGHYYKSLKDPISGNLDPTVQAWLTGFVGFGALSGTFTITSNRELRLIIAEAALAGGDTATFATQINAVRAFDGKPAWTGQIPALQMLVFERSAQLFLMRRRLSDLYRFGQTVAEWKTNANFKSAVNTPGLLFPIPNSERLANPCINNPGACK